MASESCPIGAKATVCHIVNRNCGFPQLIDIFELFQSHFILYIVIKLCLVVQFFFEMCLSFQLGCLVSLIFVYIQVVVSAGI